MVVDSLNKTFYLACTKISIIELKIAISSWVCWGGWISSIVKEWVNIFCCSRRHVKLPFEDEHRGLFLLGFFCSTIMQWSWLTKQYYQILINECGTTFFVGMAGGYLPSFCIFLGLIIDSYLPNLHKEGQMTYNSWNVLFSW